MPHISVTLYKGRDKETLDKIANALHESLRDYCNPEALSVSIREVDPPDFVPIVQERLKDEELVLASNSIQQE